MKAHLWSDRKKEFAEFAASCGLPGFPDPAGERYIYEMDGTSCKKGEWPEFLDQVWNALVEAHGRNDLKVRD